MMIKVVLVLYVLALADASHHRYTTWSMEQLSSDLPGGDVLINIEAAWRYTWNSCPSETLYLGDGKSQTMTMTTTLYNTVADWRFCEGSYTHTYLSDGPFTLKYSGSARIGELKNNANGAWDLRGQFALSYDPNFFSATPVVTGFPIVTVYRSSTPSTFLVPIFVADFTPITVSFQTWASFTNPTGMTVLDDGYIEWATSGVTSGMYSVQLTIIKSNGISIPLDFIAILADPGSTVPVMTSPANGANYRVFTNQQAIVPFAASNADTFEVTGVDALTTTTVVGTGITADHVTLSEDVSIVSYCARAYSGGLTGTVSDQVCFTVTTVDCTVTCASYEVCLDGQCTCPPGKYGSACHIDCPVCGGGGHCGTPLTCDCNNTGYDGPLCDIPICNNACQNGGTCVAPETCNCVGTGMSGPTCTNPVCSQPCENGVCVSVLPDVCECDDGWSGDQCEEAICTVPCENGAACGAPDECDCTGMDFSGPTCGDPVCSSTCKNGGRCLSVLPDVCDCADGWTGTYCASPDCSSNPCVGGVCSAPYTCSCFTGYSGTTCLPDCLPHEVADSDYSVAGSIEGSSGDQVTVTCDSGTQIVLECQSDGTWSSDTCPSHHCLGEMVDSNYATPGSMIGTHGDTVSVVCDLGFIGGGTATCVAGSGWVGASACLAAVCHDTQVAHSDYAAHGSLSGAAGDTIAVVCDSGYSGSGSAVCDYTGSWVLPTCSICGCGVPTKGGGSGGTGGGDPEFVSTCASFRGPGTTGVPCGESCTISCPVGSLGTAVVRTCTGQDTWDTKATPICTEIVEETPVEVTPVPAEVTIASKEPKGKRKAEEVAPHKAQKVAPHKAHKEQEVADTSSVSVPAVAGALVPVAAVLLVAFAVVKRRSVAYSTVSTEEPMLI